MKGKIKKPTKIKAVFKINLIFVSFTIKFTW